MLQACVGFAIADLVTKAFPRFFLMYFVCDKHWL